MLATVPRGRREREGIPDRQNRVRILRRRKASLVAASHHEGSIVAWQPLFPPLEGHRPPRLGVACGLIFVALDRLGFTGYRPSRRLRPGLNGLVTGGAMIMAAGWHGIGGYIIHSLVPRSLSSWWPPPSPWVWVRSGRSGRCIRALHRASLVAGVFALLLPPFQRVGGCRRGRAVASSAGGPARLSPPATSRRVAPQRHLRVFGVASGIVWPASLAWADERAGRLARWIVSLRDAERVSCHDSRSLNGPPPPSPTRVLPDGQVPLGEGTQARACCGWGVAGATPRRIVDLDIAPGERVLVHSR